MVNKAEVGLEQCHLGEVKYRQDNLLQLALSGVTDTTCLHRPGNWSWSSRSPNLYPSNPTLTDSARTLNSSSELIIGSGFPSSKVE